MYSDAMYSPGSSLTSVLTRMRAANASSVPIQMPVCIYIMLSHALSSGLITLFTHVSVDLAAHMALCHVCHVV
jgi:hypothetical protein